MNYKLKNLAVVFFGLLGAILLFIPSLANYYSPYMNNIELFVLSYPYILTGLFCILMSVITYKLEIQ